MREQPALGDLARPMESTLATRPAAADETHQRSRAWRRSIVAVPLMVAFAVAVLVAGRVSSAPFRLHVSTSFIGMTVADDTHLQFRATEWSMGPAELAALGRRARRPCRRWHAPRVRQHLAADRLEVWLKAGDDLVLKRLPGEPAAYVLSLPSRPAEVTASLAPGTTVVLEASDGSASAAPAQRSPVRLKLGGAPGSQIRFPSPASRDAPEGLNQRMAVRRLGFGEQGRTGVDVGLTSGGLHFLDKPDNELALYRGNDLRLGDITGEVAGLQLTGDGIDVSASGFVDAAALVVAGALGEDHRRSVMPARYDWLKSEPVIAVAVAFVGLCAGVLGLLLSAAQALPAIGRWIEQLAAP
jgi:hypothetical protein